MEVNITKENSITFEKAVIGNINDVTTFVEEKLETMDCPMKVIMQIDVAIDELFSNIVNYGYEDGGIITVCVDELQDPRRVAITFIDEAIPYDPLAKEDPDVTLDIKDRSIGGLGIYLVKKTMDHMEYEYKDKKNILRIEKNL